MFEINLHMADSLHILISVHEGVLAFRFHEMTPRKTKTFYWNSQISNKSEKDIWKYKLHSCQVQYSGNTCILIMQVFICC